MAPLSPTPVLMAAPQRPGFLPQRPTVPNPAGREASAPLVSAPSRLFQESVLSRRLRALQHLSSPGGCSRTLGPRAAGGPENAEEAGGRWSPRGHARHCWSTPQPAAGGAADALARGCPSPLGPLARLCSPCPSFPPVLFIVSSFHSKRWVASALSASACAVGLASPGPKSHERTCGPSGPRLRGHRRGVTSDFGRQRPCQCNLVFGS